MFLRIFFFPFFYIEIYVKMYEKEHWIKKVSVIGINKLFYYFLRNLKVDFVMK